MNQQEECLHREVSHHKALFFIVDFLNAHPSANLYLVGGAVRDILLGRAIAEADLDLVITGLESERIVRWFKAYGEIDLVGQRFGVYKFLPRGYSPKRIPPIDIALPRTEAMSEGSLGGYKDFEIQTDPTLPIEDDLARRDFTINALAFDVRRSVLIDPHNGLADLSNQSIRAVGKANERFTEDLSRMLRGIRFACQLGFSIEPETSAAMTELMPRIQSTREREGLEEFIVPRETVGSELAKALSSNPARGIELMRTHKMMETLFPDVHTLIQLQPTYLKPLTHTKPHELTVVLSLLLRGLSRKQIQQTLSVTGLESLPRHQTNRVEVSEVLCLIEQIQESLSPMDIVSMRASHFEKRFMNGVGLKLLRCLELLGSEDALHEARTRRSQIEHRWLVDEDEHIASLISGQDILAHHIPPGPEVRIWLDRIRDLQLDGQLLHREQALGWLKEQLKQKSPN